MTDANDVLRRQLEKIAKEQKYVDHRIKVTPISSDGANYSSKLYLATISAPQKRDLKLFAKVSVFGDKVREHMAANLFEVENSTYNVLGKIYERIQDRYDVPDEYCFKMPKFYGYDGTYLEETLVLEDLAARGFTTHDRMESIGFDYAMKSLEELAKWHALSIAFQEDYPKEFKEVVAKAFEMKSDIGPMMAQVMKDVTDKTLGCIKDAENRDRLRKFLEKANTLEFYTPFAAPTKRPVLSHGDFRMSNIMHRYRENKLEVLVIDYQATHVGSGIRDVLYFLLSGTDGQFRQKHFHALIDHYYMELCTMLRRLKQDPEKLFPREDFDYELKENIPWGIVLTIFVIPMVTVEVEDVPTINKEVGLESMLALQTSGLYETRMNELVSDFVKWNWI